MKWKERNIMQFLPRAKGFQGCGILLFSGMDEELHFSSAALTPKAGLIMWSSTVHLIEMSHFIHCEKCGRSLWCFSSMNVKAWKSDLFTYYADSYTADRMILYEYRCGGA